MNEGDLPTRANTWAQLLREAQAVAPAEIDGIDAEYLLAHVLDRNRAGLYARLSDLAPPQSAAEFHALWQRRCAGEPYAYLTGVREFYGRRFHVSSAVLIPRPDTETLLDAALERWPSGQTGTVLDAGTGSGVLAISFKLERRHSEILAVDRSREALAVAQGNARRLQAPVQFWCGDWLAALTPASVDLILSNPPYLDALDPHLPGLVASGEPQSALVAAQAGLADVFELIRAAPMVLRRGGWLLMEHGWNQASAVRAALQAQGYLDVSSTRDLAGQERISAGRVQ